MNHQSPLTYTIGIDKPEFTISTTKSVFDRSNKTLHLSLPEKLLVIPNSSLQTSMEGTRFLYLDIFIYDLNKQLFQQMRFTDIKILFHDIENGAHIVKFSYLNEQIF